MKLLAIAVAARCSSALRKYCTSIPIGQTELARFIDADRTLTVASGVSVEQHVHFDLTGFSQLRDDGLRALEPLFTSVQVVLFLEMALTNEDN